MGEKVKIKVEKKLHDGEIVRIEELHFEIPKQIIEELQWEDGTVGVGKVMMIKSFYEMLMTRF